MAQLPHRFSRDNVDRFMPAIRQLLDGKPPFIINCLDLSLRSTTCLARFGDAIIAVQRHYRDLLTEDEQSRLSDIRAKVKLTPQATDVLVELKQKAPTSTTAGVEPIQTYTLDFALTDTKDITAVCHLMSNHHLLGPVKIQQVPEHVVAWINTNYDLVATRQSDGSIIIL